MGNKASEPQPTQSSHSLNHSRIRINNELQDIQNNPPAHWKVIVHSQFEWSIWITAEDKSPFRRVPFEVKVYFPENYPFGPAEFKIVQFHRFFHPNIGQSKGHICEQSVFNVRPASTKVRDLADAFVILLSNPNPYSALNKKAAKMIFDDEENHTHEYFKTALLTFQGRK